MAKYRLLSVDGAGMGFVFEARVLARLEAAHPGFVAAADVFAGTSAGAINAGCLAAGAAPARLVELAKDYGPKIFKGSWRRSLAVNTGWWRTGWYSQEPLAEALHEAIEAGWRPATAEADPKAVQGRRPLGGLLKPVIIPAVALAGPDLKCPACKFFSTVDPLDVDRTFPAIEAILGSAAAPFYFRAREHEGWALIDGALTGANSPAIAAAEEIFKFDPAAEIVTLSIGPGAGATDQPPGYGLIHGLLWTLKTMLAASSEATTYLAGRSDAGPFHRVNPPARPYALDASDKIGQMIEDADAADLSPALRWLDIYWSGGSKLLTRSAPPTVSVEAPKPD